ncbi:hypothetical protein C8A00DRAFT_13902 [Chaetomidium leptoderma]|uniref:Actin-like ATPase domain-containing protein n=1 Tax=Chaetomidium leptoderma TaxID=669021 RepID=A0AAN6VNT2_9PEZI|nr:hypothetical protein C8A00DRAFT_13902 [Chaetomidium leptoderma]
MASTESDNGNTVIVGIDFGTTYSGVAFTWSKKIERMEVISSWDAELHSSSDEEKTPTAISFGSKRKVSWGYSIPLDAKQARWFKLLLIDDKDLPADVRKSTKIKEARAYLKKHNKTPIAVIADFLRLLWNHCNQRITETVSRNLVNYSKFHIVITLPAIWPDYARGRMREAVGQAGMLGERVAGETTLSFISEPEAAALATLSDMEDRRDIEAGDSFVVVDCGGGTVDLISYEVISTGPMVVRECVKGQGGLCGAVFVDEAFLKVLKQKFGGKAWDKMKAQTRCRLVHDDWEHGIKPTFNGQKQTWVINMPFECIDLKAIKAGFTLPKITLTADDIRGAFDPTVEKIRAMVDEQVAAVKLKKEAGPKYVIMVGGFGRCKYLFTSLKEHFEDGIEVLQSRGSGPWTAICRGAVIHAANIQGLPTFSVDIQARVARAKYGVPCNVEWCPETHDPRDKAWDEDCQEWDARDQMEWFLKIGDDMSTNKPVRFPFWSMYAAEEATTTRLSETIYTSANSPSPKRLGDNNVVELCTISWDTKLDISSLPTFTNSLGKVFHELVFEVEMTCAGGSLDFAIYHNGKRQGSKNVVVDYETRS